MGRTAKGCIGVLFFMAIALWGCGHKTPPIPPRSYMPRPVELKEIRVRPEGVYITFRLPKKYVKKGEITSGVFYRVDRCTGDRCITVVEDRGDPGSLITVRDKGTQEGMFYQYMVKPRALARGIPSEASVKVGPWPPPLLNVKAKALQDRVLVTWKGEGPFFLYKRPERGEYGLVPLVLVRGEKYEDRDVENGVTYHYVMRGVREKGILVMEGPPSKEVSATPRDTVPPPTPQGLSVHYRKGVAYLAWDPVSVGDLAGYHVYKRVTGGSWVLVVKEVLPRPTYVDEKIKKGQEYEYRVVAVDMSGNVSSPSQVVSIKIPVKGE